MHGALHGADGALENQHAVDGAHPVLALDDFEQFQIAQAAGQQVKTGALLAGPGDHRRLVAH
ncbi:hypothetical protein D3C81_2337650 [compost metagenome]